MCATTKIIVVLAFAFVDIAFGSDEGLILTCPDGETAYFDTNICDGFTECPDGFDESECSNGSNCIDSSLRYGCGDGGPCVKLPQLCGIKEDCPHGEDEMGEGCSIQPDKPSSICPESQFFCEIVGHCIPKTQKCDGIHQSKNNRDEEDFENDKIDLTTTRSSSQKMEIARTPSTARKHSRHSTTKKRKVPKQCRKDEKSPNCIKYVRKLKRKCEKKPKKRCQKYQDFINSLDIQTVDKSTVKRKKKSKRCKKNGKGKKCNTDATIM